MNKEGSRAIALAGIGSAISLIAVVLAGYVEIATITLNVVGAVGILLPFTKGYWKSGVLAYIAVSLLSMLITGFLPVMPFVIFFGSYVPIMYFLNFKSDKLKAKLKKPLFYALTTLVKAVYFAIVLVIAFSYFKLFMAEIVIFGNGNLAVWLLCLLGYIAFFGYDVVLSFVFYNLRNFVERVIYKKRPSSRTKKPDDLSKLENNATAESFESLDKKNKTEVDKKTEGNKGETEKKEGKKNDDIFDI